MSLPSPFAPSEASDASTSSSSRPSAPHLESDSDDPSFDLEHVHTSTPRKSAHRAHRQSDPRGDRDDDDPLHASDTESLDLDLAQGDIDRRLHTHDRPASSTTPPLTRRSLLQLSQPRDGAAPFASSSAARLALSFRRGNNDLYAPSPSTGSSTLVDREEDVTRKPGALSSAVRYGDDDVTVRRARVQLSVGRQGALVDDEYEDEDQETEQPGRAVSDEGESSSPRPRRSRVGDLASYVDARMSSSTPRRSPKRNRQTPATPAAPGAYPGSARKPSSFCPAASFPSSSSSTPHRLDSALFPSAPTSTSTGTPSSQIHDAFSRLITGPDGALAHSAERRAALAATSPPPPRAAEPPTPHPVGHYAFVPTTSLPVERPARRREASRGRELDGEELDGRGGTPARPSKLERALRHLGQAQREAVEAGRGRDEREGEFGSREDEWGHAVEEEERRAEHVDGAAAGRSAIDFAMARSFRHDDERPASPSDDTDLRASSARHRAAPLRASHSVRFASPPPRRRSPSTSPAQSPHPPPPPGARERSTTPPLPPPSPTLPPLPPPLEPDSPEPLRRSRRPDLMRRSHSSASPPLDDAAPLLNAAPPARPRSAPSPSTSQQRAPAPAPAPVLALDVDPAPPLARQPPLSPPPARERWTRPSSSTPPRGAHVDPPSPRRTPPRAGSEHEPERQRGAAAEGGGEAEGKGEGEGEGEGDRSAEDTVQALVGQLAAAVQALTASRAAGVTAAATAAVEEVRAPAGLEREGPQLRGEVERRRKESEKRWAAREREMRELEARGGEEATRRAGMLEQLVETYEHEHDLGSKVEELKRSIEGIGQLVGDQVAQAVGSSLAAGTRRRSQWLALALVAQLVLILFLLRLANSHALALFQTVYHDPFAPPALFHLPASSSSSSYSPFSFSLGGGGLSALDGEPFLSPETRTTFSPHPHPLAAGTGAGPGPLASVFGALKLVAQRWVPRGGAGAGGGGGAVARVVRVPS
ncbi:hypothetical protein JCM8208_006388 [Rhodotorula glutinis]